jgi:hypothetical protein
MEEHDEERTRPSDETSLATGPFSAALDECSAVLSKIKERVDDHLGVSPDEVTWGHVADADRLLLHLRHAAFAADVLGEPAQ